MSLDDEVIALEQEMLGLVRRARAATSERARNVHPGLDPTNYPLLTLLAVGDKPLRVSELAEQLSLDKSTVSRQIDTVSRLGLVKRIPDPDDARARLVLLTPEGAETIKQQLATQRKQLWDLLRSWDESEVAELTRLLRKLDQNHGK